MEVRCASFIFFVFIRHLSNRCISLESEFWLAIGKVTLAVGLMAFTFVTMVGGNPLHDKYGFRNWDCTFYLLILSLDLLTYTL